MTYKKVKRKMTNKENRPKYYSGSSNWELLDLEKKKVVGKYKSVKELADKNRQLSFSVWRNIINGTVNKYDKKYKLKKLSL
tara:strand:+ start:278 stop:520 length:243 start_codon:yes stop_codon:yes gene_type:complete